MEEKINLLLNKAIQKYLVLAKCARNAQAVGKSDEEEFCLLTRLHAVIHALQTAPEILDYDKLRELEKIVNQIGGRDDIPYRPIVQNPVLTAPEKNCCDEIEGIKNELQELRDLINYEPPTLLLESLDFAPGKYEVGHGLVLTDIRWTANKKPLTVIDIDFPDNPNTQSVNLAGITENISIDLRVAMPVLKRVYGFYHDKQVYRGEHLIAEDSLDFRSAWPFYWGKGLGTAIDNPATRNAFLHSLTKAFEVPEFLETDLAEGEYFWFFFPYTGMAKQFWTENGAIAGSWKGTFDGFQTASMVANGISGGVEYGIVRFDETGIGQLIVKVIDLPNPEVTVQEPEVIPVIPTVPSPDVILYEFTWSDPLCVQIDQ